MATRTARVSVPNPPRCSCGAPIPLRDGDTYHQKRCQCRFPFADDHTHWDNDAACEEHLADWVPISRTPDDIRDSLLFMYRYAR
jgi:hypothetical protein